MLAALLSALGRFFDGLKVAVVVMPWEQAIRVWCGRKVTDLEPGIWWKWPFLHRVLKQSVRERSARLGRQPLSTQDLKVVSLSVAVQWEIRCLRTLYETSQHPEDTLRNRARARLLHYVASRPLAELTAAAIAETVGEELEAELEPYGIGVLEVLIGELATTPTLRLIGDDDDSGWGSALATEDEPQQGAA